MRRWLKLDTIGGIMPHEPKRRHSRERKGERRASIKLAIKKAVKCQNCGTMIISHLVCKSCGFYKGRKVIKKQVKK